MAEGDTDVSICSQALLLLGANQITSFSDGTAPLRFARFYIHGLSLRPLVCIIGLLLYLRLH